ncbi:MAG: hypothetical protein QGI56_01720, partial [Dehalococcoidia bacterium]|nr:hypothetical protein [Dehalococcoidia bacterium]
MSSSANMVAGFSTGTGPRIDWRKHKSFAALAVLFALLALSLGCGLIGGGDDAEEDLAGTEQTVEGEDAE